MGEVFSLRMCYAEAADARMLSRWKHAISAGKTSVEMLIQAR